MYTHSQCKILHRVDLQHTVHMSTDAKTGSQTRRIINLVKSPAPAQWKDFCEQTPIDEARHSVTLFQLL